MGGDHADFGDLLAQEFLDVGQVGDARCHEKALPAAIMFAQQRLAQDHWIPWHDVGPHCEAIDRRCLDDREFAQAGHRHLQRARDRRGGQCQHVDIGLECFQPLLVGDAKTLFLVDNDESQAFEFQPLGQQCMRADNDVDPSLGHPILGHLCLGSRDKTRETPDVEREPLKPLDEGPVMLPREERGRADQGNLMPRHRCRERRAQRDFGFAEADVAADKPVHRSAAAEVTKDVFDGAVLIVGFLIGKAVDEFVERPIAFDDVCRAQRALGGDSDEITRDGADALLHLRFAPLPRFPAKPIERCAFAIRAVT